MQGNINLKYEELLKDFRKLINPVLEFYDEDIFKDELFSILISSFRRNIHTLDVIAKLLEDYTDEDNHRYYYYSDAALVMIRRMLEDFLVFMELNSKEDGETLKRFRDFEIKEFYEMHEHLIQMGLSSREDFKAKSSKIETEYQNLSNNVKNAKSYIKFESKLNELVVNKKIREKDQKRILAAYNQSSRSLHASPLDLNRFKVDDTFLKISETTASMSFIFGLVTSIKIAQYIVEKYISLGRVEFKEVLTELNEAWNYFHSITNKEGELF